MYPVDGKVIYTDGKPATDLAGATVVFESAEARVNAAGEVDGSGAFKLTTRRPNDGAPPGKYRVLIAPPEEQGVTDDSSGKKDGRPRKKRVLDPRYSAFQTSGLDTAVEARANQVTLTIERPN
jgi:hypothetical protein